MSSGVLRSVPASGVPDLEPALATNRTSLLTALERSLDWYEKPSSREAFPVNGVSHDWARTSVFAFRELVLTAGSVSEAARAVLDEFEVLASVGHDGAGTVLFTGYYSPSFEGSRTRTEGYRYPLYRRPADLVTEPRTGRTLGRRVDGRLEPYPTRRQLEESGVLDGLELVWLNDPFEAYLVQLQGSAVIRLPDGTTMNVAYDGSNGHAYTSVARELVADGKLREDELSVPEVRSYFERHPGELGRYLKRNDRFVFFREETGADWPQGSLGVKVTPLRSIATDKGVFPPGSVVLVDTRAPDVGGGTRRLYRFMLDQDAGGAISSPGRVDIYYGIGDLAETLAGGQYSEGSLYYLLLRPERVHHWRSRMIE